jgi:hypothetical protein
MSVCLNAVFVIQLIEAFCSLSDLCQRGDFSSAGFIRNTSTFFLREQEQADNKLN